MGLFLQSRSLGFLCAVIQKAHPWLGNTHRFLDIQRADHAKLEQEFRRTLHIGAAVNNERMTPGSVRHHRTKGRPADALDPLDQKRRAGEQSACTSC